MKIWLYNRARSIARRLGFVVRRNNYYSRDDWRLLHFLEMNEIDTVLDVGANRGQYGLELMNSGFSGRILSIEAQPGVYDELTKRALGFGGRWIVAPRCAVGDREGTVTFHITNNAASSSMLRPADVSDEMPEIFKVRRTISVECKRLDLLVAEVGIRSEKIFLKLDVQGSEQRVLHGAEALLQQVRGLSVEMSLRRYYDQQPLARELDAQIVGQGFELWDIVPVLRHVETGRLDQFDAVYFRP